MSLIRASENFDRWQALLDLILTSFSYMDLLIDPPSSAYRLTPESLSKKAAAEHLYLALDGDNIVGCAFFQPRMDCLYIGKIAVLPEYQGAGIGGRLMQSAENLAEEMGIRTLRLETRIELTRNHRVFTRLGFVKVAETAHLGFDRATSIVMEKAL